MSWPVSPGFMAAVAAGTEWEIFTSVLGPDLTPLLTGIKLEPGSSVQVNGLSIARRTGSATVADQPGLREVIAPQNPWLIQAGLWVAGALEMVPVMTGWLPEDTEEIVAHGSVWTLPLRGREFLAEEAQFTEPTTYLAGTRVGEVVRRVGEAAGMGTSDDLWDIDDDGAFLAVDHTYEEKVRRLDVEDQVCRDNALDFAPDPLSVMVLRPFPDPAAAAPVATYQRGRDVRMLGFRKRRSYRPKNVFVVIGTGGPLPVRYRLSDDDPKSTYSTRNIGERVDYYESAGITTLDQAHAVCSMRFASRGSIEETIEMLVPPNPALDGLDVIAIAETRSGTMGQFLLTSFNVPLDRSAQTLSVTRVRDAA